MKPRPSHESELEKITGRSLAAGAILSFSVLAGKKPVLGLYPEKIQQEIEEWLNLFRLLKPTDLTVVYQIVHPVSIFEHSISENKELPKISFWLGKVDHKETSSYKLYLKATEVEYYRHL
ncbi:MAG: hypothetical protein IPL12_15830 [Bacteroidetes bacterium]|nr:hypothetical protein [Bacteroidota bacterium]